LEWFDDDELPNENTAIDRDKYIGKCKLTFWLPPTRQIG
jgi:hypothetical protein